MKFRKVYEVKGFTAEGELRFRRFAANKATAERIAKQTETDEPIIDVTNEYKDGFIKEDGIERS